MTIWTTDDLRSKQECYKVDQTFRVHPYVLDSSSRSDVDGFDISRTENDYVWSIISCLDGELFASYLEADDMVKLLNILNFSK